MKKRKRGGGFLEEWLGGKAPDPTKLSRNTVRNDRWDKADYDRLLDEMKEFDSERDRFCDSVTETGNGFWADSYWSLVKVDPKFLPDGDIRPSYLVNKAVQDEVRGLKEYDEVRSLGTIGDDYAAAMGTISMRPTYEELFDKLEQEQKLAQQIEEQLSQLSGMEGEDADIDKMMEDLENDGEGEGKEAKNYQNWKDLLNKQMEELRKQIEQDTNQLQDDLAKKRPMIKAAAKQAMEAAKGEAEAQAQAADAWGLEPGYLHRLPHKERMELAKRLNNPKLRKIAQLFGPMKRLMFTEQRRKVNHAVDEVYDIELGNDLARVLPAELAKLSHPLRKLEFYKDYTERKLPQYKMRGEEKVGRGPIIFCEDGSGSMSGERELWAKAVGLCLLHLAKQQKRQFRVIHFGSPGQMWVKEFNTPEDFSLENILDFAEFFFGGGTDFVTPLSKALDWLKEEHENTGAVKSDIVFVTDGQCGVPDKWLEDFLHEKEKLKFICWGVVIGGTRNDEPLASICSKKVFGVKDLRSGEDVRGALGTIGGAAA